MQGHLVQLDKVWMCNESELTVFFPLPQAYANGITSAEAVQLNGDVA